MPTQPALSGRRLSPFGALLSLLIAGAMAYVAWHVMLRSATTGVPSGAPAATAPRASCSFPAHSWTDRQGRTRPIADLTEIVNRHALWVSSKGHNGEKADLGAHTDAEPAADLSCVDLHGVQLQQADLRRVELTGASLAGADLSGARLNGADLTGADLSNANLTGAHLESADPEAAPPAGSCGCVAPAGPSSGGNHPPPAEPISTTQTDLSGARLEHAALDDANLQNALFVEQADLLKASLLRTTLSGTDFTSADLRDANFTQARFTDQSDLGEARLAGLVFRPARLPDAQQVYSARDLQLLTFTDGDKRALTELRKRFESEGYDLQQRQITYALQRTNAVEEWKACLPGADSEGLWKHHHYISVVSNCAGASLNKLLFDLTFQYGMNPNRPLYIVSALWLVCSILYVVIIKARRRSAIFFVCQRQYRDGRTIIRQTRIVPRALDAAGVLGRSWQTVRRETALWRVALFFSLQSALNIGFQEFQFGRWLRLLTTREYTLKAEGWARTLSGVQSLLSLLMLALSIWGLFGQPFSS